MPKRRVLYTVEEAASLLGIAPSTMYRWARTGELRTVPVGGRMAVPASSLEQLLGAPSVDPDECSSHPDESLNHVCIAGRLVADAKTGKSRSGLRYATMRLAIRRHGATSEPFQVVVVAFGARTEIVATLKPNDLIRVDGRLDQREWTAEDGTRIGAQRIVAERIQVLELAPSEPVAS
jgi:excisionase family DNA binding protein